MERLVNKVRIYANNNIRSNNIRKDLEGQSVYGVCASAG